MGGEAHGGLEDLPPLGQVGVDGGESFLGTADVGGDAGLLGLQGGDVDGARAVGVEELAPLRLGLGELADEELALGGVAVLASGDLGFQLFAQPLQPGLGELDALVEVLDLGFDDTGLPMTFVSTDGTSVWALGSAPPYGSDAGLLAKIAATAGTMSDKAQLPATGNIVPDTLGVYAGTAWVINDGAGTLTRISP